MTTTRPAPLPPYELDEGWHFEARTPDDWRPDTSGRECSRTGCHRTAVAAMNRGQYRWRDDRYVRHDAWWRYCARHMADYHKWVEHGQVMSWEPIPSDMSEQQA